MSRNIVIQYLTWHFFDTTKGILGAWQNCLKFNLNYWSVPLLLKTWFSPWRRYQYSYGKGFSFTKYFEVFTFNMTSRILGAIMRSVLIVLGLLTEVSVFLVGSTVLLIWLVLPILLALSFIYGFKILL
ncbi:MAG: hypothetical protein A2654_00910 [Candidatus Nealsonbacteria bacterium RIFCSPHIGHO2_01_FULL_43_31]|uniref:Uncharacterized protein n=2 Tax=Candidatus Nealsoniibacteriota TaxID=1817911 RepID=A0A1G2E7C0_9BACT|nr:MAG: hypothetical protein A2654_00910 [Candidatus Nealsonbacteria bacterium RIFCSPHIGHO2_01_FULL_43_31]OGZ21736.1 MAG: hypothetical protein A3D46_01700 [Candidatus Nealsonbacteria bacterium RIFCSPHIGHO2_02_FULL_43_13]OGZ25227.1 MAG: hypothetical protein A2922_00090 [Candidatus Nealsonbacteria bacterium RIFCSPLOWO2_01_FULL_43_36]